MTDLIQEIYGTIMRNKLRTILTGFSVAWGIFMLIVLLGAGNGLIHAFEGQSQNMKMNSIKIYPGIYIETVQRTERRPKTLAERKRSSAYRRGIPR